MSRKEELAGEASTQTSGEQADSDEIQNEVQNEVQLKTASAAEDEPQVTASVDEIESSQVEDDASPSEPETSGDNG